MTPIKAHFQLGFWECYLKQLSLFKEDLPFVNHAVSRTSIIVTIPHLSPNHGKSCGTMGLLGYLKKVVSSRRRIMSHCTQPICMLIDQYPHLCVFFFLRATSISDIKCNAVQNNPPQCSIYFFLAEFHMVFVCLK